jgi:hypothetical protein
MRLAERAEPFGRVTPSKSWNFSQRRRVALLEMYRRFVVVIGLALCGVLAGCSSSPSVPKHAPGPGPAGPITVQAGTLASGTGLIKATFSIERAGMYGYVLTSSHVPPQPGAPPERCLSLGGFRLTNSSGTVSIPESVSFSSSIGTGSVRLSVGTWTGSDGFLSSAQALTGLTISPPPPPIGSFWAGACPWSLTLTPSS